MRQQHNRVNSSRIKTADLWHTKMEHVNYFATDSQSIPTLCCNNKIYQLFKKRQSVEVEEAILNRGYVLGSDK